MARPRKGFRVLGPYRVYSRYRVITIDEEGNRDISSFESEEEAKEVAQQLRSMAVERVTLWDVLEKYKKYLEAKGNKAKSVGLTMYRMLLFMDETMPIDGITHKQLQSAYLERAKHVAADSHRNELAELKTFWRWVVSKRFVKTSPAEKIEPIGKRKRGKPQLRRGEARKFVSTALPMAQAGHDGALAALSLLMLGLRSGEIRSRRTRDVDCDANRVWLWIENGKTDAATRQLEVHEPLASLLVIQAKKNSEKGLVFPARTSRGYRGATWLRKNIRKICDQAGVPYVPPHGLRGTWATIAKEAGVATHAVAMELGHTNPSVTREHYLDQGAEDRAMANDVAKIFRDEKKDSEEEE